MKFTPVTLGYILVLLAGGLLVQMRGTYLERMSRRIEIREPASYILRPAIWMYHAPLLLVGLGAFAAFYVFQDPVVVRILIAGGLGLLAISAGVWWFRNLLGASLTIAEGRVTYAEGKDRIVVEAKEVERVSIYWFSFKVDLRSKKVVLIPGTFRSSEIVLAFLRQAAAKNSRNG